MSHQKYLDASRKSPGSVIFIEVISGYRTYDQDAHLVAERCGKKTVKIERHITVTVSPEEVGHLRSSGLNCVVIPLGAISDLAKRHGVSDEEAREIYNERSSL